MSKDSCPSTLSVHRNLTTCWSGGFDRATDRVKAIAEAVSLELSDVVLFAHTTYVFCPLAIICGLTA